MPEYLAPGVFIEEIERGPKPIEGVATSTAAFLGATERGPSRPRLNTSYNEYLRIFGDIFGTDNYMPYAVKAFFDNGGRRCYIARVAGAGAEKATAEIAGFTVTSYGVGEAYNEVEVLIGPGATLDGQGNPIGFRLEVKYRDEVVENFTDLSVDPGKQDFYKRRVNRGNSAFVELDASDDVALPAADASETLSDGDDGGALGVPEYEGNDPDPNERTGLAALDLDPYREVAIVYAPGAADNVATAVITHAENNRFRVAVIDSQANQAVATTLDPRSSLADSQYAAFYYPWYYVSDPRSGDRKRIPPGGAVCGIYALTDNTRGVFKAPANEVVAGAIDLEYDTDQGTQEVLNPRGVNAIRRFPGRGIRVWGARTLSSDPLWKYINVRRLLVFLEASIYNSTQWVVFEPNDPRLWRRVEQTITLFLRGQWRAGALFGDKEEEAFSVAVDRSTMTDDDILNGRLIVEIGVAPVRPAEFVVFRIFQKTQEANA